MPSERETIQIEPVDDLVIGVSKPASVKIVNYGDKPVTFKMRSTRLGSIKPSVSYGVVGENGGSAKIRIRYKPKDAEKPLGRHDRVTVLIVDCPEDFENAWYYWTSNQALNTPAQRYVLHLKSPGDGISETEEDDEEQEQDEEESEESSQESSESGSSFTQSEGSQHMPQPDEEEEM